MGLVVYTVREGDVDGRILSEDYRHPGPDEPQTDEGVDLGDGPDWRVVSLWETDEASPTPDANTLIVKRADDN
jgi:hypothetical protein